MRDEQDPSRVRRYRILGALAVLILFGIALRTLQLLLHRYHWRDIRLAFGNLPREGVFLAIGFTLASFAVLTLYDALALRYVGRRVPYRRSMFVSIVGFALGNSVSPGFVSGGAVRYRMFSAYGLEGFEIAKIITFCSMMTGLGMTLFGGLGLTLSPGLLESFEYVPDAIVRPIGVMLFAPAALLLAASFKHKKVWRLRNREFQLPSPRIAVGQVFIPLIDYALAGTVLYVLLPAGSLSFSEFAGVYAASVALGFISHVPGGLGVFESLVVALTSTRVSGDQALAALLGYRVIYYLVPLGVGVTLITAYEFMERRAAVRRTMGAFYDFVGPIIPSLYAAGVFASGAVLLLSGAMPAAHSRFRAMRELVSLPVIELSHFLASIAGVMLLVLARGLQRRVDAAYWLSCGLLSVGALLSLLKGFDYEEAVLLTCLLLGLLPARTQFYRRASLMAPRISPGWLLAMGLVLGAAVWLGLFAHKHVEYQDELWWRMSYAGHASRSLRATVGALVAGLALGAAQLMRPRPAKPHPPTDEELECAARIAANCTSTTANLALLGDKSLLFNDDRTAFIMYGVEGRSWVSMGGPFGPEAARNDLIWKFRELVDAHGGWPVFYQVAAEDVHDFVDAGLQMLKLGEDAKVDLATFSLQGGARKDIRNVLHKLEKAKVSFRVVPVSEVPALLPRLRQISDAWLRTRNAREKGFSLGLFDESYLKRFPQAVAEKDGRIVAFTNLWLAADKQEASVDLMRFDEDAPSGVMDFLFAKCILWAKEEGYRVFSLGMAPLAGLETRAPAPLWHKVGNLIYRHGEHFYNFEGLRQYKDKLDPVWEPRYLASPGGLALPQILTNVAALIAGGVGGIIRK
jgi:phosphatidylglycerol lysyltransferase